MLAVIGGAAIPTLAQTLQTLNTQQNVLDKASADVSQMLVAALNQETGLRGYVLTSDRAFLQPYTSGSKAYRTAVEQLRHLQLGADFRRQLNLTNEALTSWRRFSEVVIASRATLKAPAVQSLAVSNTGKSRFDVFRQDQSILQQLAKAQLQQSRDLLRTRVKTSLALVAVALLFGFVVGGALWTLWRVFGRESALREQRLADSAMLQQSIIDASPDSIFAKDTEGRHILANRARITALTRGDPAAGPVIGRSVDPFVSQDDARAIRSVEERVIKEGGVIETQETLEQPDGVHVYATTKSPLTDAQGTVTGVVGVARDVTLELELLADRERMFELQRNLAESVQRAMLGRNPVDDPRFELCARYQPATNELTVGGDWYDLIQTAADTITLIVGDVAGHGIASATAMGQLRSGLAALAVAGLDPATALESMNNFIATIPQALMATCTVAQINFDSRQLLFSSAGHLPPLIALDGNVEFLHQVTDPPLSLKRSAQRSTNLVDLSENFTMLLFTDGLVERRGEILDQGMSRLHRAMSANLGESLDDLCDALVAETVGDQARQNDDLAIVCVRSAPGRWSATP